MTELDYDELQSVAQNLRNDVDVAEIDGLMAGMLISGPGLSAAKLLGNLKDFLQEDSKQQLDAFQQGYLVQLTTVLAEHAQGLHAVDDMEWTPLLPDEDVGVVVQLGALALWCAGFIHGVGIALGSDDGPARDHELPGDTQELLSDLAEIARVDVESIAGNEAEADYTELYEYVRTAAFSCAIEFSNWKPDMPEAPGSDLLQ